MTGYSEKIIYSTSVDFQDFSICVHICTYVHSDKNICLKVNWSEEIIFLLMFDKSCNAQKSSFI